MNRRRGPSAPDVIFLIAETLREETLIQADWESSKTTGRTIMFCQSLCCSPSPLGSEFPLRGFRRLKKLRRGPKAPDVCSPSASPIPFVVLLFILLYPYTFFCSPKRFIVLPNVFPTTRTSSQRCADYFLSRPPNVLFVS